MKKQDYTTTITVNTTAQEAFKIINNVPGWWTTIFEGHSEKLNDVFTVRFGETFITVKIIELIPGRKIGWHIIDCYKHWLKDKKEWRDTAMSWEIFPANNATQISFTHFGLVPGIECYEGCEKAWNFYVNESLFKLLTQGKGKPELK
ncbi:MAG: SRPBCC domain-containing protein [Chitinophagaceae bacterium]